MTDTRPCDSKFQKIYPSTFAAVRDRTRFCNKQMINNKKYPEITVYEYFLHGPVDYVVISRYVFGGHRLNQQIIPAHLVESDFRSRARRLEIPLPDNVLSMLNDSSEYGPWQTIEERQGNSGVNIWPKQ